MADGLTIDNGQRLIIMMIIIISNALDQAGTNRKQESGTSNEFQSTGGG